MNRVVGPLLAGLGAFLLGLAVLLPTVVVPRFEKAPLDQYTVSTAEGTGTYLNTETFEFVREDDITVTRVTRADVDDSGDDVAMYDSSQTVETGQMTEPLNVVTERIRFDRDSGIGVGGRGDRPDHEGAYAVKLPFNTEKGDYLWHDANAAEAFPVSFEREDELLGLPVYVFRGTIAEVQRAQTNVPGALVGSSAPSVFVEEYYSNDEFLLYVEPRTGSVVSTSTSPRRFFRPVAIGTDLGAQETTIFQADLTASEETQQELVADARDAKDQLNLYGRTLPLVLGLIGALLLLGGIALAVAARRRREVVGEHASY